MVNVFRRGWIGTVFGGAGLAVLALGVLPAAAQERASAPENLLNQQRIIDEQLRQQRRDVAPIDSLLDFQWGGWLDYFVFHFDDGIETQRVMQQTSSAIWTRLRLDDGAHEIFARLRLSYHYFNPGDEYDRQQDWVGPEFDRLFYQIDVGRALHLPNDPLRTRIRVGRQNVQFGTGYALDLPLDAVLIESRIGEFVVTGLFGKTVGHYPNIDRSEPVDYEMDRRFAGVELKYRGIDRHEPFVYALWNDDYTDERPKDWMQNYAYDTQYFGFGSRGEIVQRLNYWVEGVLERGHSFGDGDFLEQDSVRAFGVDAGVEYLFKGPMRPRLGGEYMFASGDSGRVFNATGAAGGNRGDEEDTGFNAFGFRDTGLALGPALSNVHIFRASGSLTPFHEVELLRDMELGTNWFLYHKHHSRGAISDTTADMFEGYIGWEMDWFINWRLSADLSWTARWGLFFPGSAYSDRDERSFFFTGLTWSF